MGQRPPCALFRARGLGRDGFDSGPRVSLAVRVRPLLGKLSLAAAALATACAAPAPAPAPALATPRPVPPASDHPTAEAAEPPAPEPAPELEKPADPAAAPAPPDPAASDAPPAPPPSFPDKIPVPLDRPVFVAHAPAGERRAIVYLHGRCGDPFAFQSFAAAVTRHATLISLQGDVRCDGGQRSTWSHDTALLDRRALAALKAVGAARGAPLDAESVTLIGYSLGAARAEALVKRAPRRYRRAILVAGPEPPEAASLAGVGAVVLIAGARDRRSHLEEAAASLAAAGVPATFMLLPGAKHGEYGPEGKRVLEEALTWALAKAP